MRLPLSTLIWKVRIAIRDLSRRLFPSIFTEEADAWRWSWVAIETVLFCSAALVLRIWLEPDDPFGIDSQFPWLWLVPALLAMRYGTAIGITCVLLLVGSWLLVYETSFIGKGDTAHFPESYFLGGLILVLICGQFSDVWNARARRLRTVNAYLDERLKTLTKNHFLLRLSHERLEQDLLAKPLTLRETLTRLRELTTRTPPSAADVMPGAAEFMQLLGQSCQLEIAAVYTIDASGRPHEEPRAVLGAPGSLRRNDPLLIYALEQNMLSHVQTDVIAQDGRDSSHYLICAPLLASDGTVTGLLTIEKLPFFALNDDTLQLLSVLIGYYADGLRLGSIVRDILARLPTCPVDLALDVVRLHRIRHEAGIDSSLVALVFENNAAALNIFEQVKRLKRVVDLSWEITGAEHTALITLLPLATTAAVDGYLMRIESAIQSQFGAGFTASHVVTHTAQVGFSSPQETLGELVERCAL